MRLAMLVAFTACHHESPHEWRGDAGPASFTDQTSPLGGLLWTEYVEASRTFPARLVKLRCHRLGALRE
jgi:hypothetical protein